MVHPGIMIGISITSPKNTRKTTKGGGGVCKVSKNTTNAFCKYCKFKHLEHGAALAGNLSI